LWPCCVGGRSRSRRAASDITVGPGRVLVCALVIAWGAAAVFVSLNRPQEPLP
jgi:hypothetical protein